jgi:UDP-2,3-diacylglucosamine pyrophosphatase LpxH
MIKSKKIGKNIIDVSIALDKDNRSAEFLLISDVHFDNPKCKREILKKHLDQAVKKGAKIMVNGDTFCIMQGVNDRRHSKSDVRPEHMGINYFDLVIDEAVEWWSPYAEHIIFFAYGNHETAVIKRNEFDILQRFVQLLNYKNNTNVLVGGYSGWVRLGATRSGRYCTGLIKYHHGYGGGGAVTRGTIQHYRMANSVMNADVIWMGHVHELYHLTSIKEYIKTNKKTEVCFKHVHEVRTATYKEEFEDGAHGWHIERGAPPKPLGGYWMQAEIVRSRVAGEDVLTMQFSFTPAIGYQ